MAEYSDARIENIVVKLLCVVDPQVKNGLGHMRYILLKQEKPPFLFDNPDKGNPALYINKKITMNAIVSMVNSQAISLKAEKGNSIVVSPGALDKKPIIYGILLHEMAHAWLDTGKATNNEANAYKFEIQWVCTLASKSNHEYSQEMKSGLDAYFEKRKNQSGWPADQIAWEKSRLKL